MYLYLLNGCTYQWVYQNVIGEEYRIEETWGIQAEKVLEQQHLDSFRYIRSNRRATRWGL